MFTSWVDERQKRDQDSKNMDDDDDMMTDDLDDSLSSAPDVDDSDFMDEDTHEAPLDDSYMHQCKILHPKDLINDQLVAIESIHELFQV